jgi:hypothetical protein
VGNSVGTLSWMRETNGVLRPRDRIRLLAQGALLMLKVVPAELRGALGLQPARLARFDLEQLRLPDSAASREADQLCAQEPPVIVNHSYRSYVWSAILAAHDGISYDEELLYVASLLHDIGFVAPERARRDSRPCCFTLNGVEATMGLSPESGWAGSRREAAAEAIAMHLNLRVGLTHAAEAHLLYAGTRLDATGLRLWDIDPETVDAVLARHPREGLKRAFVEAFECLARASPGTRSHFYTRYLGGNRFIKRARFDE